MNRTAANPTRILHIEQDAKYARMVQDSLAQCAPRELEFVHAESIEAAIEQLSEQEFDVVLLEPLQADSEAVRNLQEICNSAAAIPMVVLTSNTDESLALRSMETGLQDYLIKGQTDGAGVLQAIQFAIQRHDQYQAAPPTAATPPAGPLRILLIEDNLGDALLIEESLANVPNSQCQIRIVHRLDHALQQLARAEFSAAVVDLSLPDSRGLETCVVLRQQAPGLPLVVHSGSSDPTLAIKTIQQGASDYLVKGRTSGHDLIRSIRFAIQRQQRPTTVPARFTPAQVSVAAGAASAAPRPPTVAPAQPDRVPTEFRPASDHRTCERYSVVRSALVIPIGPGGRPDWAARLMGVTADLGRDGMGLELATANIASPSLMVGLERRDGVLCYAGLEVRHTETISPHRLRVGCQFGGRGQELLAPASLAPTFDPVSSRLTYACGEDVLAAWCEIDVLRRIPLDRVQVCPRCNALPTFRPGCRSCGSGRIVAERLIHHFACAHVAAVGDFEQADGLACPKCRTRRLIIGSDFEYQPGRSRCQDCHWTGTDLEQVGQCLACGFRFPGGQAFVQELTGYHVHRLDPLAFISAS